MLDHFNGLKLFPDGPKSLENTRNERFRLSRYGLKKISSKNIDFEILKIDFEKKILKIFEILVEMEDIPFVKGSGPQTPWKPTSVQKRLVHSCRHSATRGFQHYNREVTMSKSRITD